MKPKEKSQSLETETTIKKVSSNIDSKRLEIFDRNDHSGSLNPNAFSSGHNQSAFLPPVTV